MNLYFLSLRLLGFLFCLALLLFFNCNSNHNRNLFRWLLLYSFLCFLRGLIDIFVFLCFHFFYLLNFHEFWLLLLPNLFNRSLLFLNFLLFLYLFLFLFLLNFLNICWILTYNRSFSQFLQTNHIESALPQKRKLFLTLNLVEQRTGFILISSQYQIIDLKFRTIHNLCKLLYHILFVRND